MLATSNSFETEIFIWNLNNIRKNKHYGESMADVPDKTLLIGEDWRVVNFKWFNNKSNSILVSVKHDKDPGKFRLMQYDVGTCDHFQMSKTTKRMELSPLIEYDYDYIIEDFSFLHNDSTKIFITGERKQALIEFSTGNLIREFNTIFNSNLNKEEENKLKEKTDEDEEKERFVDVIETTRNHVMFAFNKFSKIEIHHLNKSDAPMNINFDKQICSIQSNIYNTSIFLVLVNDMFVLFDNNNMKGYRMIEYPAYIFHDIRWSHRDKNLALICGEFRKNEQITYSGFIKLKRFKEFSELINNNN